MKDAVRTAIVLLAFGAAAFARHRRPDPRRLSQIRRAVLASTKHSSSGAATPSAATRCRSPAIRRWSGRPPTHRRPCSYARARPGPGSRGSWRRAQQGRSSASRCRSPGTPWSSAAPDPSLGGRGLGLRVRALGDDLDRAAEAPGVRRSSGRPVRHVRVGLRGHGGGRGASRTTTRATRCGLGVRVRALGDHLDPAAEASRLGRSGVRLLRQLGVDLRGHAWWSGRPLTTRRPARCGHGVRVRALGDHLDRAAEAPGVRRSARRQLRPLGVGLRRHGGGRGGHRRHAGRRGCGLGVRVRALGHDLDRAAEAPGLGRRGGRLLRHLGVGLRGHGGGRGAISTTRRAARMRARRTCSCARARPGPSSRSSWRRTERRTTSSATRCRSPGTRRWSGRR